jgi:hypothetical protein
MNLYGVEDIKHDNVFYSRMKHDSIAKLAVDPDTFWVTPEQDVTTVVELPNHHALTFRGTPPPTELEAIGLEYFDLLKAEAKKRNTRMIFENIAFWTSISMLVYLAGLGTAWVIRGFKKSQETKRD